MFLTTEAFFDDIIELTLPSTDFENLINLTPPSGLNLGEQDEEFDEMLNSRHMSCPNSAFQESLDELGIPRDSEELFETRDVPIDEDTSIDLSVLSHTPSNPELRYSYEVTVDEAKEYYDDARPEFCIQRKPKQTKKAVYHKTTGEAVQMSFRPFPKYCGY